MFKDQIVAQVRHARRKHAESFNFNLKRIAEDLNKKQKHSNRKTISYTPKPPRSRKSA